jgi:hypothetical protein
MKRRRSDMERQRESEMKSQREREKYRLIEMDIPRGTETLR